MGTQSVNLGRSAGFGAVRAHGWLEQVREEREAGQVLSHRWLGKAMGAEGGTEGSPGRLGKSIPGREGCGDEGGEG